MNIPPIPHSALRVPHLILLSLLLAGFMTGCSSGYRGTRTPLQPGDQITFTDEARAAEFRIQSMNDITSTGLVVHIERPATILTE